MPFDRTCAHIFLASKNEQFDHYASEKSSAQVVCMRSVQVVFYIELAV